MTIPFDDLLPALPDPAWQARTDRLMAMTRDERVAAMRAGQLSYRELCHWSAARPSEVPRLTTGEGGPGEFEWIAALTPEMAENDEQASRARDDRQRAAHTQTQQRRAPGRGRRSADISR